MEKIEMLKRRLDGNTYAQIAEVAGVSRQRVQQQLSPPPAVKSYIHKKYDGRCAECQIGLGQRGHIHHKTTDTCIDDYNDLDNLELLCATCHRLKHWDMTTGSTFEERLAAWKPGQGPEPQAK